MFSVEVHEKFKENTHGNLVKILGVFDTENEAWKCKYKQESLISDNQVIDIYEVKD